MEVEKWRRTAYGADYIVGDHPIGRLSKGFNWEVWPTKKGRRVAITKFSDGNGYQIEGDDLENVTRRIGRHLRALDDLNREVDRIAPTPTQGED